MTAQEVYYQFHLLFNKNNESKEVNIPVENFIILYNREAEIWLRDYIKVNKVDSEILKIAELIRSEYRVKELSSNNDRVVYEIPKDLFDIIPGTIKSITKKPCSGIIYNTVFKIENISIVLADKFLRPSINWERGVATLSDNKLFIYTRDFTIDNTVISYYKKFKHIDIEGYTKFDNTASQNIDPDYSDFIIGQILNKVVLEVQRQYQDQVGIQVAKDR